MRRLIRVSATGLSLLLAAACGTVEHHAAVQERSPPVRVDAGGSAARPAPAAPARAPSKPASANVSPKPSGPSENSAATGARAGTEDPVAVATPLRSPADPVPAGAGRSSTGRPDSTGPVADGSSTGSSGSSGAAPGAPAGVSASAGSPATSPPHGKAVEWAWPIDATITQHFSVAQKGMDFSAPLGTPVRAAAAGKVSFVGSSLHGYGRMVVLKHDDGYLSVYAHNRKVLVKEGDVIRRGQVIAEMGNSDSDTVVLHFEIRHLGKAIDPVQLLPAHAAGH